MQVYRVDLTFAGLRKTSFHVVSLDENAFVEEIRKHFRELRPDSGDSVFVLRITELPKSAARNGMTIVYW